MKKTKRQKAYEWKHLMATNVFNMPYMKRHNRRLNEKRGHRFKLDRFATTVNRMIWENQNIPLFSGKVASYQKGVMISFPEKRIRILSNYN